MSDRCGKENCSDLVRARGMCNNHYHQYRRSADFQRVNASAYRDTVCALDGCAARAKTRGWCPMHYRRWKTTGDPGGVEPLHAPRRAGYTSSSGYRIVYAPNHPNSQKRGNIPEHVLVMSEILGRPLYDDENVHHKNGVRNDNRPENLELWVVRQPKGQRPEDLLVWASEIISRYGTPHVPRPAEE